MQVSLLHCIRVLLAESREVEGFRLVDLSEFAPEQHFCGMGEKAAGGHDPPASQQQVLAGGKIEAGHALTVILSYNDQRALGFEKVGQNDFEHLVILSKVNG